MTSGNNGPIESREISPLGLLPKKLIHDFIQKKPEALAEAKAWVDKNGLIILFTQGKAKGWEKVWVTDEGEIRIEIIK
jgi:hypothetical protein